MFNFLRLKQDGFGLDFSDLSLKFAKIEQKGNVFQLVSFGDARIPSGIIEKGEIKDESALSVIIKKGLANIQGKKIKTNYVISSLPEEKSFLDILKIPTIKEEEIERVVMFEAENHVPLPLSDVYFDFEKVEAASESAEHQEILLMAVPRKIADSYVRVLKMAGLQPLAMETESLAIVRALVKKDVYFEPLLVIDVGETRTSFIIAADKNLVFTATIPISSFELSQIVAKTLGVSLEKAEELKIKEGLEGKKEVFEAMVPALTDLAEQIKNHLDYYRSHSSGLVVAQHGKRIEKIILCGGGACLKGLDGFLASELEIEVEVGNPWANISKPAKKTSEAQFKKALGYTTVFGLALRGAKISSK